MIPVSPSHDSGGFLHMIPVSPSHDSGGFLHMIPVSPSHDPVGFLRMIPVSPSHNHGGCLHMIPVSPSHKAAYIQIRHISSIQHLLTTQATQTLVCSLVLSRLDYCNSLLSGCPQYLLGKLKKFRMQQQGLCVKLRNMTTSILFLKLYIGYQ